MAQAGDNVTLTCSNSWDRAGLFYWYKLKPGYMFQTIAAGAFQKISLEGQFMNSRFTVTKQDALYCLTINNVGKEDEATYFCQTGEIYTLAFIGGTILAVKGKVGSFRTAVYWATIKHTTE